MSDGQQQDAMANDESFSYSPEVVESYTEKETEEAMQFIKDNDLPMSDLHYALKYVRISNRAVELDDEFKEIQKRLKKLREADQAVVSPPKCGQRDINALNKAQK
ncbi:uncharacterized protein [Drosophila virilis]|uniref:Uncharacterized protein n=1 Tax=Drosophila virilis TaxID=7244 RepID=B4LCF9_DROVI|nr:uncharacterized protein LOC6622326 [Drosophila virilis]EDW69822.2 uncharacterized protein Dvir_GJ11913 [Drosophila virilis]